ncbi:MAG: hypothetical protein WC919_01470 [Candidatus Paceibacterota bacterium]|jgi:hypothetical protein
MRYFERILSEVLGKDVVAKNDVPTKKNGLQGQALYNAMKRRFNEIGDQKEDGADEQEMDRRWRAFDALATEDNKEEFMAFEKRIAIDNQHNKKFVKALEHRAHQGDNLIIWMLRLLISKTT